MDFFYTKIENSGPATARIGIKGHAPLSQFLNSSFILQFREIINLQNVRKVFDNNEVIKNCNMSVKKGSIYGFLGRNGAGKTTVLKLIAGLLQPTSGTIKVFGMSMLTDRNKILKKMGCLIESPVFFEQMSAEENLKIHLAYMGVSGLNISSVLAQVGLDNIGNLPVSKFSLGMKQRLAIARSIIHEPELLLLDEPINGLDPVGIKEMRDLFCHLSKEYGMTIVISSHILSEIEQIADTIGIIEKGKIIKETERLHSQEGTENLEQYFLETLQGGQNIDT